MPFIRRTAPICLALLTLGAAPVRAQNLVDLFELARGSDATYQSARAQYEANLARSDQSRALILPSASASGGASRNMFDNSTPAFERNYNALTASIGASQPLYRPANWAGYEQGMKLVDAARAQLVVAEQELVIRVGQAYFDVLAAQDTLAFVKAQKAAVAEQLAFAKRNFEVGTATITDTREAQARYDLVQAQEIAADNDLRVKKLALDTVVSKNDTQPGDVDTWVQQAESGHPVLQQALVALDVARLETVKARAGHKPTVDLTASYGINHNPQGSPTTAVGTRSTLATVGVQLNVPLFAGFSVQNRIRETLSLEDKAQADLDAARRAITQNTRAASRSVWCPARARSARSRRPKPPARARWTPTDWATRWACASTSTCSTPKASCSRPSATWRMRATTCCWAVCACARPTAACNRKTCLA
jgi:outer membrane protein